MKGCMVSHADLLVGLQLTHSGRYSRPNRKDLPEPVILYRHPYLDPRVGVVSDDAVLSDEGIQKLIQDYIQAAELAAEAGFGSSISSIAMAISGMSS